jgi:RimJ/RimL family protein N-acetyltransferase
VLRIGSRLTIADAAEIVGWRYPPPYAYYDPHRDEVGVYVDPDGGYRAIRDDHDALIGFYCVGAAAQVPGGGYHDDAVDLGVGLHPDWIGRRMGPTVIDAVMTRLAEERAVPRFRATVAAFNARALRACAKVGFQESGRFASARDGREFVVLMTPLRR